MVRVAPKDNDAAIAAVSWISPGTIYRTKFKIFGKYEPSFIQIYKIRARPPLRLLLANVQLQENEMEDMGLLGPHPRRDLSTPHHLDQAVALDGRNCVWSRENAGLLQDKGRWALCVHYWCQSEWTVFCQRKNSYCEDVDRMMSAVSIYQLRIIFWEYMYNFCLYCSIFCFLLYF